MSAVFNHAMRHEWLDRNPISKVRTSSKRLRETDVLTPEEFAALLPELNLRERAMVILAGSTGLRRSELVALTWSDIDLVLMQVNVRRSCVRSRFGDTKTEASRKPVPLHPTVARILSVWRTQTLYAADSDFVFPSIRLNGKKPVTPDMVLKKTIRPALERAGIKDQGDRMAQLPSLACDESSCGRRGLEDGPGTASSRELANHPRGVHASDLVQEARGQ
jgi:integrase